MNSVNTGDIEADFDQYTVSFLFDLAEDPNARVQTDG